MAGCFLLPGSPVGTRALSTRLASTFVGLERQQQGRQCDLLTPPLLDYGRGRGELMGSVGHGLSKEDHTTSGIVSWMCVSLLGITSTLPSVHPLGTILFLKISEAFAFINSLQALTEHLLSSGKC